MWDAKVSAYTQLSTLVHMLFSCRASPHKYLHSLPLVYVGVCVCEQKLERRRSLGGGPWGALIASFTQDEEHVVAAFTVSLRGDTHTYTHRGRKRHAWAQQMCMYFPGVHVRMCVCVCVCVSSQDGSFYVWRAANASLVRSFTLSVPPDPSTGPPPPAALHPLRSAHTTMTLSPDGRLMVAAGLELPFLLVFNWVSVTHTHTHRYQVAQHVSHAGRVLHVLMCGSVCVLSWPGVWHVPVRSVAARHPVWLRACHRRIPAGLCVAAPCRPSVCHESG